MGEKKNILKHWSCYIGVYRRQLASISGASRGNEQRGRTCFQRVVFARTSSLAEVLLRESVYTSAFGTVRQLRRVSYTSRAVSRSRVRVYHRG